MILFAKAPVPGRVKTRLAAAIGAEPAAELYGAFVADTLAKLAGFKDLADNELHTDIPTDAWIDSGVTRDLQGAGGLELKLLHALARAIGAGRPQAMVLGSDSPTLPPGHIQRLLDSAADVALGPSDDGGYYAIACRRVHSAMFAGVEWSTPHVLEQTERAARAAGLSVDRGDLWYDVDGPEDLARLVQEPVLPPCTRQAVLRIGRVS